ncbi:MAG TPA: 4'-phosphopantetheinyl transferase superfamily protein, partial [Chitinophagaceae bacterium]|nr:4'-phosphopantetheinyl transferase superfamily protein [Chitinophagaceae bacterium]
EVKPMEDFFHFMVDHFSKEERKWILNEKTERRQLSMLYTFWTMKEALVKSLAVGLSDSLKKYEVLSFLRKPLGNTTFNSPDNSWCIDRVPIAKNYKAAVALKAEKMNRRIFDYNIEEESVAPILK